MRLEDFIDLPEPSESTPSQGGDIEQLINAIRHVESRGNRNAVSSQGASGSMQIMPGTFRQYAMAGESYDNDEDRTRAAIRKIADDYEYFDGDLAKTAAAYIGGRGAVRKDGSIRNDVSDANRTTPLAYANMVLGRMGYGGGNTETKPNTDEPSRFMQFLSTDFGQAETPTQKDEPGLLADAGRLLKIGANTAAQDVRELVGRIPGVGGAIVSGIDKLDEWTHGGKSSDQLLRDDSKAMRSGLSTNTQEAMEKKWWDAESDSFGSAWSDPRAYMSGVLTSLPEQALTMFPAMRLAKGAYAVKIAQGATKEAASVAAARAAQIAGSVGEGALAGAQTARQVRDTVLGMNESEFANTDFGKALLSQGLTIEEAKRQAAEDRATQGFIAAGVTTGIFSGFGDRYLANIITGANKGSFIRRGITGGVVEGAVEELPQSYLQKVSENIALEHPATEGALNEGLAGMATGFVQGGGMASLARAQTVDEAIKATSDVLKEPVASIDDFNASVDAVGRDVRDYMRGAQPLQSAVQNSDPMSLMGDRNFLEMLSPEDRTGLVAASNILRNPTIDAVQKRTALLSVQEIIGRNMPQDWSAQNSSVQTMSIPYTQTEIPSPLSLADQSQQQDPGIPFERQTMQPPVGLTLQSKSTPQTEAANAQANTNLQQVQDQEASLSMARTHSQALTQDSGGKVSSPKMLLAEQVGNGTRVTRPEAKLIKNIGKLFKKHVVFFTDANNSVDGVVRSSDNKTIYINANSSIGAMRVFGHELMHQLETEMPKAWQVVADVVGRKIDLEAAWRDYHGVAAPDEVKAMDDALGNLQGEDRALALEAFMADGNRKNFIIREMTSDLTGNRFAEADFWRDVFTEIAKEEGRSAAERLAIKISSAIHKMVTLVTGGAFNADKMVGNLEEIRAAVKTAIRDYHTYQRGDIALSQEDIQAKADRAEQRTEFERLRDRKAGQRDALLRAGAKENHPSVERLSKEIGDLDQQIEGFSYSSTRTQVMENREGVIVGARPGEFDWTYATGGTPAPIAHPVQIDPDVSRLGPRVQKILSSKPVKQLIEDAFGVTGLKVYPTLGSYKGKPEPSFVLYGDGLDFDAADGISRMLGAMFAQEATVVTQALYSDGGETRPTYYVGSGKKLTEKQIESVRAAAQDAGLDYTTSIDNTAVKFLFFGGNEELFVSKIVEIAQAAGLKNIDRVQTRSELNEAPDYFGGTSEGVGRQVWHPESGAGSSSLFGRAIDHLLVPYAKAVGAEGYRFSPDLFADRFGLSPQWREYIRAALRPANGQKLSTAGIVAGREKLETTKSDNRAKTPRANNTDVMFALQNRAAEIGQIEPGDYSDDAKKIISQAMADEVIEHLQRPGGKSALGWYDAALKRAKAIYHQIFPELERNADREMLFDALLGIASQGNDVHLNSVFAGRMYHLITRQGNTISQAVAKLYGTFGGETRAIENNFLKFEELIDRNGYDKMRKLFNKKMTVGEWNAKLRQDKDLYFKGDPLSVEGTARQKVNGWMVFGPKIGSFINNLHGDYSTLTADLWFSRTWNRILGFSFLHTPLIEADKYNSFKAALIAEHTKTTEPRSVAANGNVKHWEHGEDINYTDAELDALMADPEAMLAEAQKLYSWYKDGYTFSHSKTDKKNGFSTKSDLRRAAKNWIEFREGSVAAPRNDSERTFQQETAEAAQKIIKRKTGEDITIADIQAALWYHEKELFKLLGVSDKKRAPADYADAASGFMERYNNGDLFYVEKPSPKYIIGNKGDYLEGNKSSYSTARGGQEDIRQRGEDASGAVRDDPPRYGHPRAKAVQVRGVHYSGEQRQTLDGFYHGRGARGEERVRLADPRNEDLRNRINFYVDEGQGIFPEQGVGDQAHDADLANLYDLKADDLGYRKLANGDANKMERLIMQGGFDGWYAPHGMGRQGVAVLVGKHTLQPRYLGTGYRGGDAKPQPVQAPTNSNADAIEKSRSLPMGQMSGSDWKRMIPLVVPGADVSMLDDAKTYYKSDVVGVIRGVRLSPKRFYSQLERSVEQAPDRVFGPAQQVKAWIISNAGKLGIKQDEIQWSGINEWLDLQGKNKVSKPDVLNYLQQNGVQVEEVEKGSKANFTNADRERYEELNRNWSTLSDTEYEELQSLQSRRDKSNGDTKYGQYVLPGGENYRELLLTLPEKVSPLQRLAGETLYSYAIRQGWSEEKAEQIRLLANEGDAAAAQIVNQYYGTVDTDAGTNFSSGHWEEPNILAHIRFNDRTDADGNKVLFIEELQSDWGQEGKKKGFAPVKLEAPLSDSEYSRALELQNKSTLSASEQNELDGLLNRHARSVPKGGMTPSAPFVTKTEAWLDLGLKRMIAYAVENGYDKVAFVNGQQSADRYDLSKQVEELMIEKDGDNFKISMKPVGQGYGAGSRWSGKAQELPDVVGKELANKVAAQPEGRSYMRGIDLKVGGEGMKTFYDQIVPQRIKEVLKKVGGGTVENVEIDTRQPEDDSYYEDITDDDILNQPGFTITPAMREKVGQGMPLFSRRRIVGDSGRQLTPDQEAMFNNIGRVVDEKTTLERLQAWIAKRWQQGIFDQFAPFRSMDIRAYTLMRLSKGATGAFEALMHHGKLSLRDGAYDADTSGGVIEKVFAPIGKETTDFLTWVAGNRAERLASEGKENLFSPQDIMAAKSLSNGTTDFDYTLPNGQVTRDRTKIYADSLKKFNEFNKNVMDMAEQSGLIDGSSRQMWEHEFYVPFYRVMDDENIKGGNVKKGVVRQEAFKKLKGGEEKLNDLLANTLMNWHHLIDASAKNRAAKAAVEAAERLGVATPAQSGESNTVWFMENGEKQLYRVDDPAVMEAITGLEYAGMKNLVMDVLTKPKHWLTVGVTASPFFKVRNLIRDSLQAIGTSDLDRNPFKNVAEGFALTNKERQEYVSALAGGGLIRFGTMLEGNEAERTRQLIKAGAKDANILNGESKLRRFYDNTLEPVISAYNELGNRGEEINRMALYNQLIKQGVDHATASLMARDLMDFSLQGSFTTIRFLAQVVPFFNARMQGMYKLGRATKENREQMAYVIFASAAAGLALMGLAASDDDKWKKWKRREEWDKANYWWFELGGMEFRIPKPFELGAVAHVAERTVEAMFDNERDAGKRLGKALLDVAMNQLSINPVPQAVKPIIDLYANKNSFTGRPIETMSMQRLDPTERFNSQTPMPARWASSLTGGVLSPVQYDHLVRSYFGWIGATSVATADIVARSINDEPTKPTLDYWKLATGGIVQGNNTASRYVSLMYDQVKELEQAHATYMALRKTGKIEEAKDYASDNADKLSAYRQVEGVKKQVSKISERIRMIERSQMTADEKRDRIDQLKRQQSELAARLSQ